MIPELKVGDVFYVAEVGLGLVKNAHYIVEETHFCGDETGVGSCVFPDGHKVVARRLTKTSRYSPKECRVEFYQSGRFIDMIEPEHIFYVETRKRVINFVK